MTAYNTFGPNGLVSRNVGGTTSLYAFDEQGNTSEIYNTAMNVVNCYVYDAYGNQQYASAGSDPPYDGFGAQWGYYHDSYTGWYLLGHRFYSPAWGRFFNRDPIGYEGGVNVYDVLQWRASQH